MALCLLPGLAWAQSPYAGRWQGSWTGVDLQQSGTVSLSVSDQGEVGGQVANQQLSRSGAIFGQVRADGTMVLLYSYDDGKSFMQARGSLALTSGHLSGTLDFLTPDDVKIGAGVFDLGLGP